VREHRTIPLNILRAGRLLYPRSAAALSNTQRQVAYCCVIAALVPRGAGSFAGKEAWRDLRDASTIGRDWIHVHACSVAMIQKH
jgi:hypothetical protein